jgi:cardiolipin synthase
MVKKIKNHPSTITPTTWKLFRSPSDAWDAMYADGESARISIEFEQYILQNDKVGNRFLRLFLRKAKEGVQVRLLLDRFGSRTIYQSRKLNVLRRHGVRVVFFNEVSGWRRLRLSSWFPRTHAKVMLVDSQIAYAGGVCFDASMERWRDTHMRATGPVAREVAAAFDSVAKRYFNMILRRTIRPAACAEGHIHFEVSRRRRERNAIYRKLLARIGKAKKKIYLVTPYFMPGKRLIRALIDARERGVEVEIMLSECTDSLVADMAIRRYLPALLQAGVRILCYKPVPHHAKIAIVDDCWATLGSMNLDYLSLFRNREGNFIIEDQFIIEDLCQDFETDRQHCRHLTFATLARQPSYYHLVGWIVHRLRGFV